MICCGIGVFLSVSAGRGGQRRAAAVADGSIWPTVPGRGAAAWAGWPGGRQPGARQSRPPLSDRGELGAGQFGVDQEAERIRPLALLHQPDENLLPELS